MYSDDVQEGMQVLDTDGTPIGMVAEVRLDPITGARPGLGTPGPHTPGKEATWFMHIAGDANGKDLWIPYEMIQRVEDGTVRLIVSLSDAEQQYAEVPLGLRHG